MKVDRGKMRSVFRVKLIRPAAISLPNVAYQVIRHCHAATDDLQYLRWVLEEDVMELPLRGRWSNQKAST